MPEDNPRIPMSPLTTAVIIGRFQPLHNGHIALIKQAMKENDTVLILVGSCNKAPDFNNPFTIEERLQMIENVFDEEGANIPFVRGLKDKPTEDEWIREVIANVARLEEDPSKVILYTSEKDEEFYNRTMIYNTCVRDSKGISATDIRANLYGALPFTMWKQEFPLANISFLKDFANSNRCHALAEESTTCLEGKTTAIANHKWANPIEPVCHAVVIHGADVLLVKRNSTRGYGQLAIPGGFMECDETTREAAIRELKEETGLDLTTVSCVELAQAVEENTDDLSVRTLGINYLYLLDHTVDKPEITIDKTECLEYTWEPIKDVLEEKTILFYNHNVVVQRLFSIYQSSPKFTESKG